MKTYYVGQKFSTQYISYSNRPYKVGEVVDIKDVRTDELVATFVVESINGMLLEGTINWVSKKLK